MRYTECLKKTTNGGDNWFNSFLCIKFIYIWKMLYFANKDTGWVSGTVISGGLWRTTNGGLKLADAIEL